MKEALAQLQGDTAILFFLALAVVVALTIILSIVLSTMRIRTYKQKYLDTALQLDQREKEIKTLKHNLSNAQKTLNLQSRELVRFEETQKRLDETVQTLKQCQKALQDLREKYARCDTQKKQHEETIDQLKKRCATLEKDNEKFNEENNKLRVNNARLLMKLNQEGL